MAEVPDRALERDDGRRELFEHFLRFFLQLLPRTLGPYRDSLDPVWDRAAELFGSFAANRGLAAGEVIEEAQILREAIMRMLYQDPPRGAAGPLGLREILRLNRVVDRLVLHASVGHTDALFFALFQGSGVPESLSDDIRWEIREQLQTLASEAEALSVTADRA